MFFKDELRSVCECLDSKFRGMRRPDQNSADIGEIAEVFVKMFLNSYLSDMFRVFRGGKIVNSNGDESPQIDVVVTTKNTPQIFADKGIYPIETVIGCVAITSTLDMPKVRSDIASLAKIPNDGQAYFRDGGSILSRVDFSETMGWLQRVPFTCIFAFEGNINQE